jgi:cytochrome c553
MKTMKTWLLRIATGLVAIILLAVAGVYVASEIRLRKTYSAPLVAFDASKFHFAAGEAERRARSLMCLSCHREAGNVIFKADHVGTLVAPNLTRLVPTYTDSELERLIRRGIRRDGTAVIAMPAATYANLSDDDLAAIIAFMRGRKRLADHPPAETQWGPLGRIALATGKIPFEADHVATTSHSATRPTDLGSYLVSTTCSHCHNLDSERDNGFGMKTPALRAMVASYAFADFDRLLASGRGKGDRDLGLMSEIARSDFSHFSAAERLALYDYLAKPQ